MTDPNPLGTALHDRVSDEHPDLDELVRASTRTGVRIRRRRRVGASLAVAAGVAVIAVGASQLGGSGGTASDEPGFANQPSGAAPDAAEKARRERQLDRLAERAARQAEALQAPVAVTAPGWTCAEPADEKFQCTSGSALVSVSWRDASDRKYYLDPDKADVLPNVHTFVSEVNGSYFATVSPTKGTTQTDVDEVGNSLVWADQ